MASKSVNIANYKDAVADGTIPGSFGEGRLKWTFPTVESVSSHGAQLFWTVVVTARLDGKQVPIADEMLEPMAETDAEGVVKSESYQVSAKGVKGAVRAVQPTIVRSGKNLGKKNQTNPVTQALREALSRYNAQAKRAPKKAEMREKPEHVKKEPEHGKKKPEHGKKEPERGKKKPERGKKEETFVKEEHKVDVMPPVAPPLTPPPMLVKKLNSTREATLDKEAFEKGITVQRKFNGVRLVARAAGKKIDLYSRTKSSYPGFDHIREELSCILQTPPAVPDDILFAGDGTLTDTEKTKLRRLYEHSPPYLDGEIYLFGKPLRWISGQARKEGDEKTLEYHVFDVFFPYAKAANHDMASAQRQAYLSLFFETAEKRGNECKLTHVKRVQNFHVKSVDEVKTLAAWFVKEGYEGAIARKDWTGYRYSYNNYHSSNLVKIKPLHDSEFPIVGYTQGKKGKDVGAVIWICKVDTEHVINPNDVEFHVVPKDVSYKDRYMIFKCLGEMVDNTPAKIAKGGAKKVSRFERDFKGEPMTVEYPDRSTKTGKPIQAKALTVRTYEGGPKNDPLHRLYSECGLLKNTPST